MARVAVVDSDPQLSIFHQREREVDTQSEASAYPIISFDWQKADEGDLPILRFHQLIEELRQQYDLILIDTPGKQEGEEIPLIVTVSDVVAVPLIASEYDLQSTMAFLTVVDRIRQRKQEKGYETLVLGVPNRKDRSSEHRFLQQMEGFAGLHLMEQGLSQLVRYKRSKSTLWDIADPSDSQDEFNRYLTELASHCLKPHSNPA
jgi:chromosome partitioning protein